MNNQAKELAEAHWAYIKSVLMTSSHYREEMIDVIGTFYKDAMFHGFGHGVEHESNRTIVTQLSII